MKIALNASFMKSENYTPSIFRKKWMSVLRHQFPFLTFGSVKALANIFFGEDGTSFEKPYIFVEIDEVGLSKEEKKTLIEEAFPLYGEIRESWSAIMLDSYEKEPKFSARDKRHEEIELLKAQMLAMVPEDEKDIFSEKLEQLLMLNVQNHIPMG
ncbi:hypothetical protein [Serratia sp. Se-RSBMAAmG]|uniref:hypothetical protein n=1 Tax=Serratia sp. Se-RSBMAAmG TaxID=3043305 RepID=UPI0024AEADB0|nr:hypothetical protein [Serratia sp. Se-RSBMAAmG]MDI6976179.1 hypothetical protein [Serratia sp. Se-RSBMAAmG]